MENSTVRHLYFAYGCYSMMAKFPEQSELYQELYAESMKEVQNIIIREYVNSGKTVAEARHTFKERTNKLA